MVEERKVVRVIEVDLGEHVAALARVAVAARAYLRGTAGDPTRGELQDALADLDAVEAANKESNAGVAGDE